jgi:alpha-N-arabinofuranosidase
MAFRESGNKKQFGPAEQGADQYPQTGWLKRLVSIDLRAEAVVNLDDVVGEIDPRIYGHFIPEQGRGGGGADLVRELHPPLLRAVMGNLSQPDHPQEEAFLKYCEELGSEPYLAIDLRRGTPEEAAHWVAYCNAPLETAPGARRAAQGHPEPYRVKLWGLFNGDNSETIDPAAYVRQIRPFIAALRAADPAIQLVVAGKNLLPGDPEGAEDWNRAILEEIGDQLDYLSIRVIYPGGAAGEDASDPERWYHSLLSAPHSVEESLQRLAALIRDGVPGREIGIVLDSFGLQLPAVLEGGSSSAPAPTLRDGLYLAGMLNAFQRQCAHLKIANFAHRMDALPLIVSPAGQAAFPTPLYYPYLLYSRMETQLLSVAHWSPVYQAEALGSAISARNQVPYIDLSATRSADGNRVVLAVTNRHPHRKAKLVVNFKGGDNRKLRTVAARLVTGPDPLAANTADAPGQVGLRAVKAPRARYAWLDLDLPPASLMVVALEKVK